MILFQTCRFTSLRPTGVFPGSGWALGLVFSAGLLTTGGLFLDEGCVWVFRPRKRWVSEHRNIYH